MDYKICCLRNKDKQASEMCEGRAPTLSMCCCCLPESRSTTVGVVPVPGSNPEEAAMPLWRFDFHQDSACSLLLSLYIQHTHTRLQGGRFYLSAMTHVCSVISFPSLIHMLRCKRANERTRLTHGDLFLLTLISPGRFRARGLLQPCVICCMRHVAVCCSTPLPYGHSVNNDRLLCNVLLRAVTRRRHGAQSTAGQEQQTLEAGPC